MQQVSIKAARISTGMTQDEMAKRLGISRSRYQLIESGTREIKSVELYALCHVTGFAETEIKLPKVSAKSEQEEAT